MDNLETFYLISFRNLIDQELQAQLRTIINYLLLFDDEEQCLEYIQSLSQDDRVILIIKDSSNLQYVSFRQITSIYIYSNNTKKSTEQRTKPSKKIKGIFSHRDELIRRIHTDYNQRCFRKLDEIFTYTIFNTKTNNSIQLFPDINTSFIHSQIFIDCLIHTDSCLNDRNELVLLCKQQYQNNPTELAIIEEFEKDYRSERSLSWYTRFSFLYRILNKAIRIQNIELLLLFRWFIRDIVEQLKSNKFLNGQRVYRAQLMSKNEVDLLKNSSGEFLSMNIFLSANSNREQTRSSLVSLTIEDNIEKVFFEINLSHQTDSVNLVVSSSSKEEMLFRIGSIFRLINIERDNDGIWNIHLMLYSSKQHPFESTIQQKKTDLNIIETNVLSIGFLLEDMGKFQSAERYYHHLVDQLPKDHEDLSRCYHALGEIIQKKDDYDLCLIWYNKALQLDIQMLKSNESDTAMSYNSIAVVYSKKRDYKLALKFYNKALDIWKKILGEDHPDIAMCWNNIGIIHQEEKQYTDALECYHKAWNIRQKHCTTEHIGLGQSLACIGNVHYQLKHYDLALEHYNSSMEIFKKFLPSCYSDVAMIYRNIGFIYQNKGDYQQALIHIKKAATIYRQLFPSTHSDVMQIEKLIHQISSKL
ncbi:hypothetical protein I4U23_020417 [Adineta vaga]|nr:hypothetical protein I4U23_020417 [Adineta vaga]